VPVPRPGEAAAGEEFAQGGDHPSPPSLTPHFALLRITVIKTPAPLQQSYPSLTLRIPLPPLPPSVGRTASVRGRKVPHRRTVIKIRGVVARWERYQGASILPPYAPPVLGRSRP